MFCFLYLTMEEITFSEILAVSSAIAQKSQVSTLRDVSLAIRKEVSSETQGIFIIAGIRGSGKTTLLAALSQNHNSLFVNVEIILRHGVKLLDFLHYASAKGYHHILLDEIHALPDWEKDIKIFYDETKGKIVLSGSSAIILRAKASELSRRARTYEMKPFSFREYLSFQTGKKFPLLAIKDIIDFPTRQKWEREIAAELPKYSSYTQFDALPAAYFEKNKETYVNILERTVRYDLASLREIDVHYLEHTFRAIKIIAASPPGELGYSGLASSLGIGIKLAREIVYSLGQTGMVTLVPPSGSGKKAVRKEEKILLPLSLRAALCNHYGFSIPVGSIREDFFVQHVGKCTYLKTGKERRTPDFVVGDYIFEVGGPSKGFEQIKGMKNAYIVKEGLPAGERELPLCLFGFLY